MTVRHLLEHRGGIGDIFGEAYERTDKSKLRDVSDWIPLFRDKPLAFEPGERQQYSNGGYVLLGAIVERASGENYYDYVRRHIYRPLGMRDTDHFASDGKTPDLAVGYTRQAPGDGTDAAGWADSAPTRPWRGSPAGGGYSTLGDLLRFVQAMRTSKLLKPETVTPEFRELRADESGNLGLGIGGGAPGINAAVEAIGPYTIVVLANLDPPAAAVPASWLAERLPGAAGRGARRMVRVGGDAGDRITMLGPSAGPAEGPGRRVERGVVGGPAGEADFGHRRETPQRSRVPEAGVEVEMLAAGHLPALRVLVNGQGPYLFGIDTGAQGTARIDSALAAKLGLEVVGQARSGDPSGLNTRTVDLVRIESLEIGGACFEGMVGGVRGAGERRLGLTLDGVLGFGLFADALLTLDYPGRKVRIERGELPANGSDVFGFTMDHGIPSVTLHVDSIAVEA
ncbi:MAG: serine hydrolase, partial [Candidatus Rokubacteria bacterium]|nr:serine hydrolase [Candidatus Rokubacteria bacterium]